MNRNDKLAKKKDLGWNLIILTLQGMMNDITNVFEGWKPTLSHSSKMSVGQNSINCVCVCENGKFSRVIGLCHTLLFNPNI